MKGRIGIAIAPSNPKIVYTWVEADTLKKPLAQAAKSRHHQSAEAQQRALSIDRRRGELDSDAAQSASDARPFYYSQVRVDPKNPDRVYWMSSVFRFSDDGGKTERRGALSFILTGMRCGSTPLIRSTSSSVTMAELPSRGTRVAPTISRIRFRSGSSTR